MAKIKSVYKEVVEKTEWVAIVTSGEDGPHLVGTWGDYIREIGLINDETIVIPAGHYYKTEENLKQNNSIQLLIASREVQGNYGPGQGCLIQAEGKIETDGEYARLVKEKFEWARGALVVKVKDCKIQL